MSNREDYLDSLLKSVTSPGEKVKKPSLITPEDEFLMKYDQELLGEDEDAFLQEFETELEEDTVSEEIKEENSEFFQELDNLVVNTLEPAGTEDLADVEYDPLLEAQLMDDSDIAPDDQLDAMLAEAMAVGAASSLEDSISFQPDLDSPGLPEDEFAVSEDFAEPEAGSEEAELLDILANMTEDADLADIGSMLKAHDEDELIGGDELGAGDEFSQMGMPDELADQMEQLGAEFSLKDSALFSGDDLSEGKGKKGKFGKKNKKKGQADDNQKEGFFQKLSRILFGEEEEEEIFVPETAEINNISDENMEILMELERGAQKEKKEKKEKKPKKEKKEKKEKPPKPPKVKKEKKPKEPREKTKPLPKAPVFLIFLMGASFVLLVYLGSNLVGYSLGVNQAQQAYDQGDYVEAYQLLSGMEIKEADQNLLERTRVTAYLKRKVDSYDIYIAREDFPEALDALIGAVGRYDEYMDRAVAAGADGEYEGLFTAVSEALAGTFGVTLEEARELYGESDRAEYTRQIYNLLERAGIVSEETTP